MSDEGFEVRQPAFNQLECYPIFPLFLHLAGPGVDGLDWTIDLSAGDQALPDGGST